MVTYYLKNHSKNIQKSEIDPPPFGLKSSFGSANWLALGTHPEIMYSNNVIARGMKNSSNEMYTKAKRIIIYMSTSVEFDLQYNIICVITRKKTFVVGY